MGVVGEKANEIERLIDRHTELCEFFDSEGAPFAHEAPLLIATNGGKTQAECLADLVGQALAVYESANFAQDPRIFSLKIALTDAIMELA